MNEPRMYPMFRFFSVLPAIAVLAASVGCASMSEEKDMLISKNKMYEKRNLLLERENSVLRSETAQAIEARHAAEAHAEKAESDRKILQKNYDADTALLRSQAANLAAQNAQIRKESGERIAALAEQNKEIEKKYGDEIRRLTEEMKLMAENFGAERETLKKDFARRETEFAEKTNALEQTIAEKERRIAELEQDAAALSSRISALNDQLSAKSRIPAPKQDAPDAGKPAAK